MLQNLNEWRTQCSAEELAGFEQYLAEPCKRAITPKALITRYGDSYHKALMNTHVISDAINTGEYIRKSYMGRSEKGSDAGREFCYLLAEENGFMSMSKTEAKYARSIQILLQRGILFEYKQHYCLPSELLLYLRGQTQLHSWISLVANTPQDLLNQLVPEHVQATMLQPKPLRRQLASWLLLAGQRSLQSDVNKLLDHDDWRILIVAERNKIDTYKDLRRFFSELNAVYLNPSYYFKESNKISLRQSLEKQMPARLLKLCRLGLLGIQTFPGNDCHASIILCDEAREQLKAHFKQQRKGIIASIPDHWLAEACEAESSSLWRMDHQMWQVWVVAHFVPLGFTLQQQLRKNDIKKISYLTSIKDSALLESLIFMMLETALLRQQGRTISPVTINWTYWATKLQTSIFKILNFGHRWGTQQQKEIYALLGQLPVECWLKLDDVVTWLQMKAEGELTLADWSSPFIKPQQCALHHYNRSQNSIYLLPQFDSVMNNKPVCFPSPGWRGADKKAKTHGFISATGEIQLPPDCNHSVLNKLSTFCIITAVEQMITLQLDQKALQRIGTDKTALKKTRSLLESIQSPLPQAITYLFDKQQEKKSIAAVAAASLVIALHDASAIEKLRKVGFEFSQPFKDKPDIILLDPTADARTFLTKCSENGIVLDTLVKPVKWISDTDFIQAWMGSNIDKKGQWLEISYLKINGKPVQSFARIENKRHGVIFIQGTRKTRQGLTLLKGTIRLEPKQVLHLRELDSTEVEELGLNKLL